LGTAYAECPAGLEPVYVGSSIELRHAWFDETPTTYATSGLVVATPEGVRNYRMGTPIGTGIPGRVFVSIDDPTDVTAMVPAERDNEAYWGGVLVREECRPE
jgi:hypothetical protein